MFIISCMGGLLQAFEIALSLHSSSVLNLAPKSYRQGKGALNEPSGVGLQSEVSV